MTEIRYSPLSFVVLVSWIVCVQGIITLPVDSLGFCHALSAETVATVIAWLSLDPEFAQLSPTQRYKAIWWKRASAGNMEVMVPKVMKRHSCTKVCGIILPKDHVAHYAVVKARTAHHYFASQISLPIAGMRIVNPPLGVEVQPPDASESQVNTTCARHTKRIYKTRHIRHIRHETQDINHKTWETYHKKIYIRHKT